MIIFLIGFMGSGKSTTGKQLAERLGYGYVDTDKWIIAEYGMSINEIFERLGEKTFRKAETRLLKELASKKNLVVSTGGGLPCHGDNMDIINKSGISIYLQASPKALLTRLSTRKHKRPLIKDLSDRELEKFIKKRLKKREPYYSRAHHTVNGLEVKIAEIVSILGD
jgi:shikimate kinase